jgi:hypothetical protein
MVTWLKWLYLSLVVCTLVSSGVSNAQEKQLEIGRPLDSQQSTLPLGRPIRVKWVEGKIVLKERKGELWPFLQVKENNQEFRLGTKDAKTAETLRTCEDMANCSIKIEPKKDTEGDYLEATEIKILAKSAQPSVAVATATPAKPDYSNKTFYLIRVGAQALNQVKSDRAGSKLFFTQKKSSLAYFPQEFYTKQNASAFCLHSHEISNTGYAIIAFIPRGESKFVPEFKGQLVSLGLPDNLSDLSADKMNFSVDTAYGIANLDPEKVSTETLRDIVGNEAEVIDSGIPLKLIAKLKELK